MAGGKETPRQKMIGLMYLVLLALLALQVGAEIMLKFQQLNDSLSSFVTESQGKSEGVLSNIADKVEERGNKGTEVKALNGAKQLHKESADLIKWIEDVKEELIEKTGGRNPETGAPMDMKNADIPSTLLIGVGEKNDGKAYTLKQKLDAHIDYLNKVSVDVAKAIGDDKPKKYAYIAKDGIDDPLFYDAVKKKELVEGAKLKDFAHLNFDHTPMVASMAFLTEKQSKIATYEGEILESMKQMVGAADFKFDVVLPMVKASSNTVVAGRMYEAEMFVSATSSTLSPKMTSSAGAVKMDGAVGKVAFRAGGGGYVNGVAKKSWSGTITIPKPTGGDTTMKLTTEYFVAEPVLKVSAGDIAALYRNCGNPLSVLCPALGADFKPSFGESKGGRVVNGKQKGEIIVYPTGKAFELAVSSDGTFIGKERFGVKSIPNPSVEVWPNGKRMSASEERQGLSAPPRSIKVVAIPDAGFKAALPSEARYYVTSWTATLVRGRRPAAAPMKFNSGVGDVGSLRSSAKTGDRILVEVQNVIRKNSQDQSEGVDVGLVVKNITF